MRSLFPVSTNTLGVASAANCERSTARKKLGRDGFQNRLDSDKIIAEIRVFVAGKDSAEKKAERASEVPSRELASSCEEQRSRGRHVYILREV